MSKLAKKSKIKQISNEAHLTTFTNVIPKPKQVGSQKSIVLEQNGETKILKKIKLKGPPKLISKVRQTLEGTDNNKKLETVRKRAFVCTFCKCIFDNQEALKEHFVKHGSESQISKNPDVAGPSPKGKSSIVLIECEWCPETFTKLSKAIEHKYRKHNYESKNYFCTLCGRLFPLKVALEQHQNIEHKDDKEMNIPRLDFICGFCGTAFICQVALELHVKTAHNLEKRMMAHPFIPKPSKKVRLNQAGEIISIYYCHLCGSEYMLKFNLLKHIEDHHSYEDRCAMPEDMFKCSTCDSMFYTKKAFDAHNIHHKPEDLYVTSEEHRLNIVARVDQDFDFRRVPTALDKALGSIGSGSSDSAALLAKKHRKKIKRIKTEPSTVISSGDGNEKHVPDLGLSALKAAPLGEDATGFDALNFLLGE